MALSLATDFPNRDLLITMTLGVALFTILVGGLTTGGLLHRLGLDQPPLVDQFIEKQALLSSKRLVVEQITNLEINSILSSEIVNDFLQKYQSQVTEAQVSLNQFNSHLQEESSSLNAQLIWLEMINWETAIQALVKVEEYMQEITIYGQINQEIAQKITQDISGSFTRL